MKLLKDERIKDYQSQQCFSVFAPATAQIFKRAGETWVASFRLTEKIFFPAGLEPATFRVLSGCDNHYTTETAYK